MSDFSAKIIAQLDTSKIPNQLKEIQNMIANKPIPIPINTSETKKEMQSIENQVGSLQKSFERTFSNSITTFTKNANNTIRHMQDTLRNAKFDNNSISYITKDLEKMNLEVSRIRTNINGNNLSLSIQGIDEIGRIVNIVKEFDYASGNISTINKSIVQSFGTSVEQAKLFKEEVNSAFSELLRIQNNISRLNKSSSVLDGEKNKREINEVTKELEELKKRYDELFEKYKDSFSNKQSNRINEAVKNSENILSRSKAKREDEYDPYAEAIKSLKSLYDIKKEYAKLGSNKDTDFYYSKAIEQAEQKYITSKSKTSEPEFWDISKQNELKRQEIALEQQYQKELKRTSSISANLLRIKNSLARSDGKNSSFSVQIDKIEQDFMKYGLSAEQAKQRVQELRNTLGLLESSSDDELSDKFIKWQNELSKVNADLGKAKISYDKLEQPASDSKITSTQLRIQKMLQNNPRITDEMRASWQRYENELNGNVTEGRLKQINLELSKNELQLRECGKWGKSFTQSFADLGKYVAGFVSLQRVADFVVQRTREAVEELKQVDTLLVEISKANDKLSEKDLSRIKEGSFSRASKYGKKATDYLLGVQEASRAGYSDAEDIAELSLAVQGAGNVTADVANKYVIATDKAYKLNGAVGELTKVFDGSNYITNNNAVNMQELAEGMSIVGSTAASLGVGVDETTAVIGTMAASTQQSGAEVSRAFKGILLNIQQVSDEEEGIDAEGLTKYESACNALNVKLKETKNGVLSLRNPMTVLKELSEEYNKLDPGDIRRTNLLSSVGGKLRSTQLDALLRNWDMYEKMLGEYKDGTGSMAVEAEKTANSWEGSLNRLSNTWTSTINNVADSDAITSTINGLNGILGILNKITDVLGSWGTVGTVAAIALNKKLNCRLHILTIG